MKAHYIIKHSPADFRVTEVAALDTVVDGIGPYYYYRLRKVGLSTVNAIELLSARHHLPAGALAVAGLKDEDAITEQALSAFSQDRLAGEIVLDAQRSLQVEGPIGRGKYPIEKGLLFGNQFKIAVRALGWELARRIAPLRGLTVIRRPILNYFDRQRFGTPESAYVSHLVGAALIAENTAKAEHLLRGDVQRRLARRGFVGMDEQRFLQASESAESNPLQYLHQRTVAFLRASANSAKWNQEVSALVQGAGDTTFLPEDSNGPCASLAIPRQLDTASLPIGHDYCDCYYNSAENRIESKPNRRTVVVDTKFFVHGADDDDAHPGSAKLTLSFFLPSGSYATMAVRQIVASVEIAP